MKWATPPPSDTAPADTAGAAANGAVQWAAGSGILTGYADGTLTPGGPATRAQTAQMLMRCSANI